MHSPSAPRCPPRSSQATERAGSWAGRPKLNATGTKGPQATDINGFVPDSGHTGSREARWPKAFDWQTGPGSIRHWKLKILKVFSFKMMCFLGFLSRGTLEGRNFGAPDRASRLGRCQGWLQTQSLDSSKALNLLSPSQSLWWSGADLTAPCCAMRPSIEHGGWAVAIAVLVHFSFYQLVSWLHLTWRRGKRPETLTPAAAAAPSSASTACTVSLGSREKANLVANA